MKGFLTRLTPYEELGGWIRGLAIALASGAFLTFSGAFGTGDAPLGARAVYWFTLMIVGYVFGSFIARLFFRNPRRQTWPSWLQVVSASLLMAVPVVIVYIYAQRYLVGGLTAGSIKG